MKAENIKHDCGCEVDNGIFIYCQIHANIAQNHNHIAKIPYKYIINGIQVIGLY